MPLLPGRRRRRLDDRPIPAHPYRDAALVYAGMGVLLVIVATLTGGRGAARDRRRSDLLRARDGVDAGGASAKRISGSDDAAAPRQRCSRERARHERTAAGTETGKEAEVTDD